jgi:hypothetical protein
MRDAETQFELVYPIKNNTMPFTKNDKNINIKGREKGVPNKTTQELKTLLVTIFENNLEEILKQQENLSLNERLNLNRTLLSYIMPTIKVESYKDDLNSSDWWSRV